MSVYCGTYSLAALTFLSVDVGLTKMTTCISMSVCYRTYSLALCMGFSVVLLWTKTSWISMSVYSGTFSLALWAFQSCCHEQRHVESLCLSTLGLSVWHTGLFSLVAMNKDKLNQYVCLLWDFQSGTLGFSVLLSWTKTSWISMSVYSGTFSLVLWAILFD